MANIIKKAFKKTRAVALRDVINSTDELKASLGNIERKVGEVEKNLHQTQLDINHHHLTVLEEINQRVKNSGTFSLSDSEVVTKIFSGLKMYLDPRDIAVVPHLILDSVWEHRITAAWLSTVKPQDVVIDIGANFGYFGALAAQVTDKKKSKVVFFEANPYLIPYMKKTLSVNWLNEQSVIENLAVSNKAGTVTLNLLKDYIGSSSIQTSEQLSTYMHDKMYLETQEEIAVQAVALDDYCREQSIDHVDLIKMDIEGYEEIAYEGMRDIIKRSPSVTLFVEFTKDGYENPKKFYDTMLKDFGWVYMIDDEGRIIKPKQTDYETVIGDADDWVMPIFSKNSKLAD